MREILFRGKDIKGNWYTGLLAHNVKKDEWYISNKAGMPTAYMVRPETITQFTNLTDKNGVKIFEGDIIHGMLGNFAVRWSDDISSFAAGEKERTRPCMNSGMMKYFEVIGNIYDNPELMGGNTNG